MIEESACDVDIVCAKGAEESATLFDAGFGGRDGGGYVGASGEVAPGAGEDCDGYFGEVGDLAERGGEGVVVVHGEGVEFFGTREGDGCDVLRGGLERWAREGEGGGGVPSSPRG